MEDMCLTGNDIGGMKILGCMSCGANKNASTHTYGVYRIYRSGGHIILRCKTCSFTYKIRVIDGG